MTRDEFSALATLCVVIVLIMVLLAFTAGAWNLVWQRG
jgi:hypothetical protein